MNTPTEVSPHQRKKILIADDDKSTCRVLSVLLKKYGDITAVECGNSAIELLKDKVFDLILADYEMPQGSGLDLLEYLNKQNNRTPTIMITAFGSKELIIKTIGHHVFGFIEKPFTQEIVERLVGEALSYKEQQCVIENLARFGTTVGEIVHEISSPLTVLDLQIREMSDDPVAVDVNKMIRSVEKIRKIITTTKESIRGTEQKLYSTLNFQDCLDDATQEFSIRATAKRVPVQVDGSSVIQVVGEKDMICQVIVNLVNNAIDAASELDSKWVKILIQADSRTLTFSVTDSGTGIDSEVQRKLFQQLFTTKGSQGNGLGLSIVKKIVDELGGTVFYNQESPNTQFVFTLPVLK